ncbi:MAG TPA: MFS transporter [Candidatus Limnocylindrales bacterium]
MSDRSYRALLAIHRLPRSLLAMQIARVAQSMVGVALVLFTLLEYNSPLLAGAVTFLSVFPGLLVAPIAGALLDRHGRVRLILLDYVVALASLVLLGVLALADLLPPALLLVIATVSSLTSILSHTGLRSLFPLIVPEHLWERVNAIDSNGYVVATILGPPIAASAVAFLGGPTALILVGLSFGIAAVAMIGVPDPPSTNTTTGSLLLDAWHGVQYTWRNRTLRGLGFSISALNIAGGVWTIVVPIIVLERLGLSEAVVGVVFAISGVAGMVSSLLFGRLDTRGREWRMLVWPMLAMAPAVALLLPASLAAAPGGLGVSVGLVVLGLSLGIMGALNGPLDIALFTVRQRRTETAWMGRAFAVSMAFNFVGFPVGAALAGIVAESSVEAAVVVAVVACVIAATLAATMIPKSDERTA